MSVSAIVAEGLVKRYGEVAALDGVSFEVARGRSSAFLGLTGRVRPRLLRS